MKHAARGKRQHGQLASQLYRGKDIASYNYLQVVVALPLMHASIMKQLKKLTYFLATIVQASVCVNSLSAGDWVTKFS